MADLAFAAFDRSRMPVVDLIFAQGEDIGVPVAKLATAAANVLSYQFGPYWGCPASVVVPPGPVPGHWALVVVDDARHAEEAGYGDLTADGMPLAHVYARVAREGGEEPSVALFRELFAMLVDPSVCMAGYGPDDTLYGYDPCDPVYGETFVLDGVTMPNFVHPTWYEDFRNAGSIAFDHNGGCTKPFQMRPGGRSATLKPGQKAWQPLMANDPSKGPMPRPTGSRWSRRLRQVRRNVKSLRIGRPVASGMTVGPV